MHFSGTDSGPAAGRRLRDASAEGTCLVGDGLHACKEPREVPLCLPLCGLVRRLAAACIGVLRLKCGLHTEKGDKKVAEFGLLPKLSFAADVCMVTVDMDSAAAATDARHEA